MNGAVRNARTHAVTRVAVPVLALALLGVAGCSGPGPAEPAASATQAAAASSIPAAPGTSPSPQPHGTRPQGAQPQGAQPESTQPPAVTLDEAREALDTFLATDEVVRAAQADRWTLVLTRDGRRPITVAQLHTHSAKGSRTGEAAPYTWSHREVFVPRQRPGSSPQWFAATAERRDASGQSRTVMLTFARAGAGSPWQNSSESLLYKGEEPPDVAVDEDGYAAALDPRDQSVAVSPNLLGPLHATVAEEGTKGFASALIAPGPHTTGFSADIEATRKEAQGRDCMSYSSIFAVGANYPIYAMRTADGGALVFYTLVRTSTWSTDPGLKCGKGRPVAIPRDARWLLTAKDVQISTKRHIQETQQYVTAVPPKTSTAPVHVIGYEGAVTEASNN
ncbi:hypothetical protein [Sphaerimonospora thailandensis]|uniref:hypothetical protein n=1 Tax=Sphaerimonospora thailandensis TaxID=795644 RepID=UPI00194E4DFD|nr:hypothetical protein [Sphaerimonospora thailandensis]